MHARSFRFLAFVLLAAALAGCGGDARSMLANNAPMREQIFAAIAGNKDLGVQMLDRFLAADSTQAMVLERVLADGDASQELMVLVARDRSKLDGIIQFAVQDTATRSHVVSLLQGIQMAAAPNAAPATKP